MENEPKVVAGYDKMVEAFEAMNNMFDTLQLDGPTKNVIKEFIKKYTIFVVDVTTYGVKAYGAIADYNEVQLKNIQNYFKEVQENTAKIMEGYKNESKET